MTYPTPLGLAPSRARSFLSRALLLSCALATANAALASSHREAPLIGADPLADNVDLYAFRSPDQEDMVTLIATYVPFQLPQGGPNYYRFSDEVRYEIHIDNDAASPGDEIVYRFTFETVNEDPTTFFYARLGQQNQKNTYTLERSNDGGENFATIVRDGYVPPQNVGPRTISGGAGLMAGGYSELFAQGITTADSGERVFAGSTDDPFFVDLGGIFDLGNSPRQVGEPRDGLGCLNVSALAIQVPISALLKDGAPAEPTSILDPDYVIGIWASASRQAVKTLSEDADPTTDGDYVQVSRLGMPLTNEAVIPIGMKDRWNRVSPYDELAETMFDSSFFNPELALYMDDDLFGSAVPAFTPLRVQTASLPGLLGDDFPGFDFSNGADGLFGLKGNAALDGTALAEDAFGSLLLPGPGQPRSVDLWPAFHTGVPNLAPYQLATGKGGNPLAVGKPFVNNFLPNGGDMLRLNMAVPATPRDDAAFSSLGLIQAAVLGLTTAPYNTSADLEFIPNMDGFPNGRRLEDDVTRIELQAVSGVVLAAIGLWYDDYDPATSTSPVTQDLLGVLTYTTGVENNDRPFQTAFPYLAEPFAGTAECAGVLATADVSDPGGAPDAVATLYVSSNTQGRVGVIERSEEGENDLTTFAVRAGDADGIFYDEDDDLLFQVNRSANVIDVYGELDANLAATVAPAYRSSSSSDFVNGREIAVSGDFLVVAQDASDDNGNQNRLVVYRRTDDEGGLTLDRNFAVGFNTWGLHADVNTLYAVVDNSNRVAVIDSFFTKQGRSVVPTRTVTVTGLVRTHGITYGADMDLMILTDVGAATDATDGAIVVVRNWSAASADGRIAAEEQVRISGAATLLGNPVDVAYDRDADLVYVAERANGGGRVLAFNTPTTSGAMTPVYNQLFGGASAIYLSGAVEDGDPVTGLIEIGGFEVGVTVAPNPTQDRLRLQLDGDLTQVRDASLSVFSLAGQRVLSKAWTPTDSGVNVAGLSPGTYVLTFAGEGFSYSETFVKL